MGCWSESCALSGLEIAYGADCYVALYAPDRHANSRDCRSYELVVPPVRGKYDDYGGIDLTESSSIFGLKEGDNWRPWNDKRGQPVYFDAELFNRIQGIPREYDFKGCKTIGEAAKHFTNDLRERLAGVNAQAEDLPAIPSEIRWYLQKLGVMDEAGINQLRPIIAQWWC